MSKFFVSNFVKKSGVRKRQIEFLTLGAKEACIKVKRGQSNNLIFVLCVSSSFIVVIKTYCIIELVFCVFSVAIAFIHEKRNQMLHLRFCYLILVYCFIIEICAKICMHGKFAYDSSP